MSFLLNTLYLLVLFSLGAYIGGDPSRLFESNAEVDDDGAFIYGLTKKGIAIPKIRLPWVIAQFAFPVVSLFYGVIAYIAQVEFFLLLNSLFSIEIKPLFDASEYLVSWIYGVLMIAGYFAGRASLYKFSAAALIDHSKQNLDRDLTFRTAFSSGYHRVQTWKERND